MAENNLKDRLGTEDCYRLAELCIKYDVLHHLYERKDDGYLNIPEEDWEELKDILKST